MAEILERVRIEGDASGYKKAVASSKRTLNDFYGTAKRGNRDVAASSAQTSKSLKSMAVSMAGAVGGVAALTKGFAILKSQISAGLKDAVLYQETQERLAIALKMSSKNADAYTATLAKEASALQDLTGHSDEIIRAMQTQAIAMGISVEKTGNLITASYGLAKAMGIDARTAMMQLIKTKQGLIDRTLKVIPAVANLTKEELRQGKAIDEVSKKYGEFAAMQGPLKQVTLLQNAWADMRESITLSVLETEKVDAAMKGITDRFAYIARGTSEMGVGFFWAAVMDPEGTAALLRASEGATLAKEAAKRAAAKAAADQAGAFDFGATSGSAPKQAEQYILTVGGKKKKGGGKKKKDPFDFSGGLEEGEGAAFSVRGEQARAEDAHQRMATMLELERTASEGKLEIWTNHYDAMEQQYARDAARKKMFEGKKTEDTRKAQERMASITTGAASLMLDTTIGVFEQMAAGADISGWKIAQGILKGIGMQLIGQGKADLLIGLSMLLKNDPKGAGVMANAGPMIALGTALVAGGAVLGKQAGGGGGGGGGGGAAAARGGGATATGATGMMRPNEPANEGPREITVVFNGPTTKAEVGVAIKDAVREAEKRGF